MGVTVDNEYELVLYIFHGKSIFISFGLCEFAQIEGGLINAFGRNRRRSVLSAVGQRVNSAIQLLLRTSKVTVSSAQERAVAAASAARAEAAACNL